ncbi:elastin isoform X2 [Esox lucius]|uniref:elastin isoform X2 n=1 Tax=Esox lucius TaxID=8010 RepID=UPI0014775C99|nr:elastin isoform X2 [Esox lucius]XP_012996158.2 elastin isoform X2 [Esox lucius]
MFCMLWIIFPTMALLAAADKGGGMNGGMGGMAGMAGMAGNAAMQPGIMNGLVLNGQPFLAQLVPVGGSLLQPGIGQAGGPQLLPIGALQQGGATVVEQAGAAGGIPLQQLSQLPNGAVPLFAVVPQANGVGGPGAPMLMQIIPVGGGNNPQQPAAAGQAGKARVKHSVPFRGSPTSTGTDPPLVTVGEVEESSGSDSPVILK